MKNELILKFDTHGNEKQKEACRYWNDRTTKDIVYGGSKNSGKSFLGCNLIFGNAFLYPETNYFIARKTLADLRKHTRMSIAEVFGIWGVTDSMFKYNDKDSFYTLYNGSKVFFFDAKYMPSDPTYSRFGSVQMTQGWIEEASQFEAEAKNNLLACVGRWNNTKYGLEGKILQTCNPGKNYLYYDYYFPNKKGTLDPEKKFIQALPSDNKMATPGYIEGLRKFFTPNQTARLLDGLWEADDDPTVLIDYPKIMDVFTNDHIPGGKHYVTADIARLGGDRIVTIKWDGLRGKVSAVKKEKLNVTTAKIEAARKENKCNKEDVVVDTDGMGSGVEDFGGFKGFRNNSRALPDPKGKRDPNGKLVVENFDNLKSQCGFRMAELMNENKVYLECSPEDRELIIEELEQVKQRNYDTDLKKGLVPKDEVKKAIGRSPDFWDAILMRIFFELRHSGIKARYKSGNEPRKPIGTGWNYQ